MNKKEKTYPVSTMAIQNRVTECFKSMSVDEKRILIMASPVARNINATEQDSILISAQQFAEECGIKVNSAYKQIEIASKKLVDRSFSYTNEKGKKVYSNWVIDATYEDAGVSLRFTSVVLMMLKILDKYNPYTRYKKDVVLKLKKDYSIDFYHLAKKSEKLGNFELTIDSMFIEFGLPESYRDLRNLKRRVLKDPIDEINKHTDIDLTYEPIKKGRSVVGFKFTVREKTKHKTITVQGRDKDTIDMFFKMSDSQINMFGNQLSKLPELGKYAVGNEGYEALASRIKDMLKDPEKQKLLVPHLKKLGFTP
ncbi:MAG: replication initiation protein [Caryophanon sp.]|jgi:plasmid replication initiation protein|uniref:replication initiation protein n=1 Tax=uncultured Acinetobacter sp. TaxID=165433 RepID=UPI0026184E9E|nr:replication initiation protein [uncultured Acinetobacter sp.]MBS7345921.1 replication initiation protein [Caryophanon sp.]